MKRNHILSGVIILIAGFSACDKDMALSWFEGFKKPDNFPEPVYHFSTNPVTKEGFELGRKLFYDPILSANHTISCGSCHIQTASFTHHGHSVSHGIFDQQGNRNAPPIMNLAWNKSFMWDGGIADLDLQAIAPITNHVEMDEKMDHVMQKLRNSTVYPALFKNAFGDDEINTITFLRALSQFVVMCVSHNSKYDSVSLHLGPVFSKEELEGYRLVKEKCTPCHQEPLFTDFSFRNNGISVSSRNDMGRFLITERDTDQYKFKVPSLRNLAFTAPYMHDGRFFTLNAVLDHYAGQVQQTPNLDQQLKNGISLSDTEKQKIIAFLGTLNDRTFLLDKRFSEP